MTPSTTHAVVGEAVAVTTSVTNMGKTKSQCGLVIEIQDPSGKISEQTKTFWLAPNESRRVTFYVWIRERGKYTIRLPDGTETRIYGEEPSPGKLEVVALYLATEIEAGSRVEIVAEVKIFPKPL